MQPRTIGPYRILKPQGSGGMGVVYQAMDRRSGVRVALKTVKIPEAELLGMMRREIHAIARLAHPGIVRIVDDGVEAGMPWYAMELLEGTSLRDYVKALFFESDAERGAPTSRRHSGSSTFALPAGEEGATPAAEAETEELAVARPPAGGGELPSVLALARRLCDPLAYMHGEGLVHRDLKPANVLVRPDGSPVLVDFGLTTSFATAAGRERVEVGGIISGTLAYMAPEQARGEIVDARADLYALGCILYELVCGRPPFQGDDASSILRQHLQVTPPRVTLRATDVPPPLERLLERLLRKDPRERLGYAEDVARELTALGAPPGATSGAPRARSYLHRPRLAGRDEPLARLGEALERLRSASAGVIFVRGISGIGKSRLLAEAASIARARDVRVVVGACEESPGSPLTPLRPLLREIADHCRERGAPTTERILGSRGAMLAAFEPALAAVPGLSATAALPELPADEGRAKLFAALDAAVTALAADGPLLVVVDDVQWADELTLGWIARTLRLPPEARLLVLCGVRSESPRPPIEECIQGGAVLLELGSLPGVAVEAMVRDMLSIPAAPATFVAFLEGRSEGNPLFVAEYLRLAVAEGILRRDEEGTWRLGGSAVEDVACERLPLPANLRGVLARRLEGLDPEARRLLERAAVMGKEVDVELLGEVWGLDAASGRGDGSERALLAAVADLERRQVLRSEGARVVIVHDGIRAEALARIGDPERASIHRQVAGVLARRPDAAEHLAELARHWRGAGELRLAHDAHLAAARRAVKGYALEEAAEHYRACIELGAGPVEELLDARLELWSSVIRFRGPLEGAEGLLTRACADAEALGLPRKLGSAWLALGVLHSVTGRTAEARSAILRARGLAIAVGNDGAHGICLGQLASIEWREGRVAEARALLEEQRGLHQRAGQGAMEAMALASLASLEAQSSSLAEAKRLYREALVLLRRSGGSRAQEGIALGTLGDLHVETSDLAAARACYEEALAIHREVGNQGHEGVALADLAHVEELAGDESRAPGLLEEAVAIHERLGNVRTLANLIARRGALLMGRGQLEAARLLAQRSLALARKADDPRLEAESRFLIGELERRAGSLVQARALLELAAEHYRKRDGKRLAEVLAELVHVGVLELRPERELRSIEEEIERVLGEEPSPLEVLLVACRLADAGRRRGVDGRSWVTRAREAAIELRLDDRSSLARRLRAMSD